MEAGLGEVCGLLTYAFPAVHRAYCVAPRSGPSTQLKEAEAGTRLSPPVLHISRVPPSQGSVRILLRVCPLTADFVIPNLM